TFAHACRPSTPSFSAHGDPTDEKAFRATTPEDPADCGDCGDGRDVRRHDAVELADPTVVPRAGAHVLADTGPPGSEQAVLGWLPRSTRAAALALAPPHDGALGADDAGRAREVPPRTAERVESVRAVRSPGRTEAVGDQR